MFQGASLIDFGAGTGENTIYLANWGASCTLVEMNPRSQSISREVFEKYANNKDAHKFHLSSIFDFNGGDPDGYDIVHCRGVLSHTAAKEDAFAKIATYVKPGGYLIFGDPNKAGGFQNMLQRYAVYKFAKTPDEMVEVSELLFKDDIDRSELAIPRTRRAIIFDRWVIQSQDDPSVAEVASWAKVAGLKIYNMYPAAMPALRGDSLHHRPQMDPYQYQDLFALAEMIWMTQTDSDADILALLQKDYEDFAKKFGALTSYVENTDSETRYSVKEFNMLVDHLAGSVQNFDPIKSIRSKFAGFLNEVKNFIELVEAGDIQSVKGFLDQAEYFSRGACGNRHIDFIAYRPEHS